jgi:hypothetical protein
MLFKTGTEPLPSSPRSHRLDESAAGYSLTGCSPALPVSASPTGLYRQAEDVHLSSNSNGTGDSPLDFGAAAGQTINYQGGPNQMIEVGQAGRSNSKSVPSAFVEFVMRQKRLFGVKELFTNYIACFCAAHDIEAMWQNYAEGGRGYGVVFDARTLLAASNGGHLYSFAPLIYDDQLQHQKTARVIDAAIQLHRRFGIPTRAFLVSGITKCCSIYLSVVPGSKTRSGGMSRRSGCRYPRSAKI